MADGDQDQGGDTRADEIVARPVESLNVELKTWLDLQDDAHAAKLVKALFALRNRNGGYLVIGFDDVTLQPDPYTLNRPFEEVYHHDEVQAKVSRYAHETFEIMVRYGRRDGNSYPVISVPEGVRTPVAVSRDLLDKSTGKALLARGDIYFRTLQSNGTPSSAKIMPADLADLMEICFDNREADIGRFFRRQLGAGGVDALRAMHGAPPAPSEAEQLKARAEALIVRGDAAFADALAASPQPEGKEHLVEALMMRVAMVAAPPHPDALPTNEFMSRVQAANPQYTGWPAWLDARGFSQANDRAHVEGDAWVTYIHGGDIGERDRLEFMRYDPKGDFFVRRLMQDDTADRVPAGVALDPVLMLYRVTEFIAAGVAVLRGAGWSEQDRAGFAFAWSGLAGRKIASWANPVRFFGVGEGYKSLTPGAVSYVEVALDTPHLALAPAVEKAVAPLFAAFNGYQPPSSLIEDAVRALVERKM